jgi:membrane-associated phospholipid phosphatase
MANILALFTVAILFIPGMRPIALVFALLMAFSRMHNGMHYPSDMLVGAVLGMVYGLIGFWLAKGLKLKA